MLKYQALFEPAEEGGFVVTFPDVEPAITQGDTEEEATLMAADVLTLAIEHYIDKGLPLPKAKTHRGPHYRWIRLPAIASAKAELHNAFLESGLRKADLAKLLHVPRAHVDRLFDLKHSTPFDQIEVALRAVGREMDISVHLIPTTRRAPRVPIS